MRGALSYRFSTVRRADRILYLRDGCIAEQGTHAALIRCNGRHVELFRMQARRYG